MKQGFIQSERWKKIRQKDKTVYLMAKTISFISIHLKLLIVSVERIYFKFIAKYAYMHMYVLRAQEDPITWEWAGLKHSFPAATFWLVEFSYAFRY